MLDRVLYYLEYYFIYFFHKFFNRILKYYCLKYNPKKIESNTQILENNSIIISNMIFNIRITNRIFK